MCESSEAEADLTRAARATERVWRAQSVDDGGWVERHDIFGASAVFGTADCLFMSSTPIAGSPLRVAKILF